ncbi:hypothetical protein SAMN05216490_4053 [Mucilaginibacter mallensis]|uniref:Uncharacterized protein n=1 Tax=Mucilaginibacter mallensis TaxID=652787 RepID=A0A1H2BDF9_MUCMA|nr:hypothetical protein [Mucilaginibacter mallensis]SDT56184.1 hypothetical protein SAMN05216490_4053 [Mucilaginibacter mallensis]
MAILSLQGNMGGNPVWNNPNVWAGDSVGNPVTPKAGNPCFLWARVFNLYNGPVNNITVSFFVLLPSGNGLWPPEAHGTNVIGQIPANGNATIYCSIPWVPDSSQSSHQCLVAVGYCDECPPPPTVPGTPVNANDIQVAQHNVDIHQLSAAETTVLRPFDINDTGHSGYVQISRAPLAANSSLLRTRGIPADIPEAPGGEQIGLADRVTGEALGEKVSYRPGERWQLNAVIDTAQRVPGTAALYHVSFVENGSVIGGVSNIILH